MDAAHSSEQDGNPAYTTSKQVQAWFLRRSRDLWKTKYADLKLELKRVRQRVAELPIRKVQWHVPGRDNPSWRKVRQTAVKRKSLDDPA